MGVNLKPDVARFCAILAQVRARMDGGARADWPRFLYHFADLTNVVSILSAGELFSRAGVAARHPDFRDSASPDIIAQTEDRWKDHVRFYVRPRTPTLYRNEGIRPSDRLELGGAHCPAPVYLLFDLEAMICRADARFSYGSLAWPGVQVYETAADFERMPFDLIYHEGRFDGAARNDIIFHRQAELVIPRRVELSALRAIWCRSPAEGAALRALLPTAALTRWGPLIHARADQHLFNREWAYIERALPLPDRLSLWINPARRLLDSGPFDLRVELRDRATGAALARTWPGVRLGGPLDIELPALPAGYDAVVRVDGHIGWAGRFRPGDEPY